jgi:hypothetical protein
MVLAYSPWRGFLTPGCEKVFYRSRLIRSDWKKVQLNQSNSFNGCEYTYAVPGDLNDHPFNGTLKLVELKNDGYRIVGC